MKNSRFKVMPFAPATFQSLMNHIFKPYHCIFVLVFFNDILAYSKDRTAHKKHLLTVFSILVEKKLHIKSAKCHIGKERLEYLGHWISAQGMAADDDKVKVIVACNIKGLCSFLGLAVYSTVGL